MTAEPQTMDETAIQQRRANCGQNDGTRDINVDWNERRISLLSGAGLLIGGLARGSLPGLAAATVARGEWVDRHGDALAGAVVALVGMAVLGLGI